MNIDFPFHFDGRGQTATTDDDNHIREMIEELLFTSPGERVNRPDFGRGLLQMLFSPNSPELAAALQYTTQDSTLSVMVKYVVKSTGDSRTENFVRSAPDV